MNPDEKHMRQCIRLAKKGLGFTSPNPLVGCVIVKNGEIIGQGYHRKYGGPHAEVNAIEDAKQKGYSLKGAEVYVNLEPCAHYGNQPPCADALIREKVGRVIIGMIDPYEKVKGRGIKKMVSAGIDVRTGILEDECKNLNKVFIKFVTEKLPYITLKIAQSIDGKIALSDYSSKWITGEVSRKFVHKLRSVNDAVLIGGNTAHKDDPSLNVRSFKGRDPKRIVIAGRRPFSKNLKVLNDYNVKNTFIIVSGQNRSVSQWENIPDGNIIFLRDEKEMIPLKKILKKLYELKISSVLVEGGSGVFSQFIKEKMFDEIYFFIAPKILGKGISAFDSLKINSMNKAVTLDNLTYRRSGKDLLLHYRKCSQE